MQPVVLKIILRDFSMSSKIAQEQQIKKSI